jgi:hypothetical protein
MEESLSVMPGRYQDRMGKCPDFLGFPGYLSRIRYIMELTLLRVDVAARRVRAETRSSTA